MRVGIDVSSVQGVVPWDKLTNVDFAFIKACQGNEINVDPFMKTNVEQARKAGIKASVYLFAYPLPNDGKHSGRDPRDQARIHRNLTSCLELDLPPAVDLEWPEPQDWKKWSCSPAQIRDWSLEYLDEATDIWGCKPIVYTYPFWWKAVSAAGGMEPFADYPLWIADYNQYMHATPPATAKPVVPFPWTDWTYWQHTGGGMKLPNGAPCDYSVCNQG